MGEKRNVARCSRRVKQDFFFFIMVAIWRRRRRRRREKKTTEKEAMSNEIYSNIFARVAYKSKLHLTLSWGASRQKKMYSCFIDSNAKLDGGRRPGGDMNQICMCVCAGERVEWAPVNV